MGLACKEIGQPEKALDYYRRAVKAARELDDPPLLCRSLDAMGQVWVLLPEC